MKFLDDILVRKRREVAERRAQRSDSELERLVSTTRATHRLHGTLSERGGPVRIIAEVKRASPSVGEIDATLDAPTLAKRYASAGAAAISILTDGPGFKGSLEDLASARAHVQVPLLRKDFVVDRYQLLEAKLAGADAALLIVAALSVADLRALHQACEILGLDALVEVHDERELDAALETGARIVGVNNRNLKTFVVDLGVSEALFPRIPSSVKAVAESGVKSENEIRRLRAVGASNFLVGEALVRAQDPAALLRQMSEVKE